VPRIVGKIRRKQPVEVPDVEFLRSNTDRAIDSHGAAQLHALGS
jgi:hypothetical protein